LNLPKFGSITVFVAEKETSKERKKEKNCQVDTAETVRWTSANHPSVRL
jgi:hypothetical protein